MKSKPTLSEIPRSADSSSPNTSLEDQNDPSSKKSAKACIVWSLSFCFLHHSNFQTLNGYKFILQVPFGYTRKDVLLIGLGVTALGIGLESGLEVYSTIRNTIVIFLSFQHTFMFYFVDVFIKFRVCDFLKISWFSLQDLIR